MEDAKLVGLSVDGRPKLLLSNGETENGREARKGDRGNERLGYLGTVRFWDSAVHNALDYFTGV